VRNFELKQKFPTDGCLEELKAMPWNAVYNYYCLQQGVPVADEYISSIQAYEDDITSKRSSR
jgi:L-rhamnose isomerase